MTLLRESTAIPSTALTVEATGGMTAWLQHYVPRSLDSVVRGAWVLVLLMSALIAALVVRRLARSKLAVVHRSVRWIADVTARVVRWVVLVSPVGILALSFALGLRAGGRAAGVLLAVVLIVPGVLQRRARGATRGTTACSPRRAAPARPLARIARSGSAQATR